jgi:hypothetical protein
MASRAKAAEENMHMSHVGLLIRLEAKPEKAEELLAKPPSIERVDVLAAKLPARA